MSCDPSLLTTEAAGLKLPSLTLAHGFTSFPDYTPPLNPPPFHLQMILGHLYWVFSSSPIIKSLHLAYGWTVSGFLSSSCFFHWCSFRSYPILHSFRLYDRTIISHIITYGRWPRGHHCSPITRGPKNCKKGTQRGPNFWQKGDPKGTLFGVKGDLKFEFFISVHKEYVKIVEKSN